ncbi:sigma factor-like helix-turn-helix DNA-binding protein [Micromonospora palomenae]|uniref:sigma factor-like helix-turn-helix DNA-binding protein n=1 Tax=Micromonospora palomenae TaxID=1461247 RepID=UPI003F8C2FA2
MDEQRSVQLEKLSRCFPGLMCFPEVAALVETAVADAAGEGGVNWRLFAVLANAVLEEGRDHISLGEMVPALWSAGNLGIFSPQRDDLGQGSDMPIAWDTRAVNRLKAHGCVKWTDLAALTPLDLSEIPRLGRKTAFEIALQVISFGWDRDGLSVEGSNGRSGASADGRGTYLGSAGNVSWAVFHEWTLGEDQALQRMWLWASTEKQARTFADLVRLLAKPEDSWPDDVRATIKHLCGVPLKQPDVRSDPIQVLIDWFEAEDERSRDLMTMRLFTMGKPATLDELARAHGVTRERIRQIEGKLLARHETWTLSPEAQPVRWRAASIREYAGPWCVVDKVLATLIGHDGHGDFLKSPAAALLLHLAGPYRRDGECLVRRGFTLPLIEEVASEVGLVDLGAYRRLLTDAGVLPAWHEAALQAQSAALRELNGEAYLWNGSLASKAVAVLSAIGQPSSADTIANTFGLGMTPNRIRNVLGTDPRVIRSGKSLWALAEWGFEEYSGIAEEIKERLDAAGGGPLQLRALINELVDAFGVSESSVRIYADAPAFLVGEGTIRLRTSDNPYPVFADLHRVRGIYFANGVLITHLALDASIIRNGSCYVHRVVAGRLGVVPGERATYSWGEHAVQLHWPLTSPAGPLLTGLRPIFDENEVTPGDVLRLKLDPIRGQVKPERVDGDALRIVDQVGRLRALTGLDLSEARDIEEQIAVAIEVQTPRARDALRDRGDEVIAASIPFRVVAETADKELAAIFGDLDRDLGLG